MLLGTHTFVLLLAKVLPLKLMPYTVPSRCPCC